jgi:hypothetical protein
MTNELKQQLEGILTKTANRGKQKIISDFFRKNVEDFNQRISVIEKNIDQKNISIDKACISVMKHMQYLLKKTKKIEDMKINRADLNKIKQLFRENIKDFINKSLLMRLGYLKLKGQPGDYKLIEMFYENKPLSEGIGFCGDKYVLQDSYVETIRIRKELMKKMLATFIKNSKLSSTNIMNIGCGSCKEIRDLFLDFPYTKEVIFTLIDWDKEALDFSQKSLIKYSANPSIKFRYINENAFIFYKYSKKYLEMFGGQDLIYSIGLADYMLDSILEEMVKFCFELLNKNGTLVIAHKNVKIHKSIGSDWACDWNFYPRNENDIKKIITKSLSKEKFKIKIIRDLTKHVFFVRIVKLCN